MLRAPARPYPALAEDEPWFCELGADPRFSSCELPEQSEAEAYFGLALEHMPEHTDMAEAEAGEAEAEAAAEAAAAAAAAARADAAEMYEEVSGWQLRLSAHSSTGYYAVCQPPDRAGRPRPFRAQLKYGGRVK